MAKREDPHPPPDSAAALTTNPSTAGSTASASASMSPQSFVSQLQAVKGSTSTSTAEPFPAGAEVEVKISAEGFYDSWYEATVVSHRSSLGPRGGIKYKVRYIEFLRDDGSGEKLVEHVSARDVRPRPPRRVNDSNEDEDPKFKMYDLVEAYLNDGWWHGVISGLRDPETGLYTVSFPNSREVFQFKPAEIRPKLVFVNGNWVSVLEEEQIEGNFKEGDNVEVHQLQGKIQSYFPAKIEKVIHNSYYLVKYDSPCARPNGDLTEILEPHYLRPAVDGIPETSFFTVGSHVEFFQKGCWSPGIVLSCLSGSDYEVTLGSKFKPMVVNVSNLRVRLDWDGQNWSKWSSPSKEKKRPSAHSRKSFTSDVALAEKDETTPNNVVSGGKKRPSAHSSKSFTSDVALAEKDETTPNNVVSRGKKRRSAHSSKSFTSDVALAEKDEITPNNVVSRGEKRPSAHSSKSFTSVVALAEKDETTPNNVVSRGKKRPSVHSSKSFTSVVALAEKDETTPNDVVSRGKKRPSAHTSKSFTSDLALAEKGEITPNNAVFRGKKRPSAHSSKSFTSDSALAEKDETTPNNVVSRGKKRPSAHTRKSFTSDVALAEKGEIIPNSAVSGGKKLKKSSRKGEEFQNPLQHKVTPSMDLESEDGVPITELFKVRPKLSKNNKSSSPKIMCAVRKVPHSRKLLTELKNCQSKISKRKRSCTCKGNLNDCQINKKQDDVSHNRWITSEKQNNVLLSMEGYSDVLQPDTSPLLPFKMTSPIWNTFKAFKMFSHMPQRPHFRMLESKSKEEREGLAIGMMVTYANLVESIQNLSIDSEVTVLEEKIACLMSLKENGFIVDPITSYLHDLLAIKTEITNSELKRNELETELANNEQENTASHAAANSCDAKLEDIRKELEEFRMRVAELELKEKSTIKEKEQVLSSAVNREQVMSKLREEICRIESSHALNLDKFECVRSRLFTKELL